jgi:hypothetical protein
VEQPRQ